MGSREGLESNRCVPRTILEKYCKNFYMLGKRSSRIGMRGEIFLAAKYWCRVRHLKKDETARQYCDWQENVIENWSWAEISTDGVRQNWFVIWQD